MRIDQRNNGASVTTAASVTYTLDRWRYNNSASKYTMQQNAGSITPPTGYTNYLGCTSTSAYTMAAGDYFQVEQPIEGYNVSDFAWGTAGAKTVTLSFQVYSSLTGTFSAWLVNNGSTRLYIFTYNIPVANTWTQISVTISGDTSGTWVTNNGIGIRLGFNLGQGSNYVGATPNTWGSSTYWQPSGCVNLINTNGATWYVTGVQLEQNTSATPFERRLYNQELANCQRYYWTTVGSRPLLVNNLVGGTNRISLPLNPVSMRTNATITYYTSDSVAGSVSEFSSGTARVVSSTNNNQAIGGGYFQTSTSFSNPAELRAEFSAEL
jgi:hypothetical protein